MKHGSQPQEDILRGGDRRRQHLECSLESPFSATIQLASSPDGLTRTRPHVSLNTEPSIPTWVSIPLLVQVLVHAHVQRMIVLHRHIHSLAQRINDCLSMVDL